MFGHYVAEIVTTNEEQKVYEVKYMRRILPAYNFVFDNEGIYLADRKDIERKLPKPKTHPGTERTMTKLSFALNFKTYNVH